MNYRSRWQQRRRREAQKRTAIVVGALSVGVLAAVGLLLMRRERAVWSREFQSSRPTQFAAYQGILYCALGDRRAQAISMRTGEPLWPKPYETTVAFGGPPAVSEDRVIFVDDNGRITALDRRTGHGVWQVGTGDAIRSAPLIHEGTVFAGDTRGVVYALSASDGLERWRLRVGGPVASGFAVVGKMLFFGASTGAILGVEWKNGSPAPWRERLVGFPVFGGPVKAGDKVIAGTDGGRAVIVGPATGRIVARVDMPDAGLVRPRPLVGEGVVYISSTDGWIVAAKLEDRGGSNLIPLWRRKVGAEISAGPTMDENYLYCGDGTPYLLAIDRATGRIARRWECPAQVRGSVAVGQGLVAAGTTDGAILVFRAPRRRS